MKKTILINIYYSFGGGGIESMISNLSCEARLQNVESHLLVIGEDLGRVNLDDYDSVNLIDGNLKSRRLAKKNRKKMFEAIRWKSVKNENTYSFTWFVGNIF